MTRYFGSVATTSGIVTVGTISTITDDTYYNAWPIVARLASGSLICVYTKAFGHHTDNSGNAVAKISADDGASWGVEIPVYSDVVTPLWSTAMGVSVLASGRVIVTLWRDNQAVSGTGQAGIVYSDDAGLTWTSWIALTNGFTQEAFGAGPAVELTAGGNILVTIEGSNSGQAIANRSSHTVKSTDHGATWGSEVTVRNYVTDSRPYYESKLLKLGSGNLLCIHRTSSGTGTHYISLSTDSGATWGTPYVAAAGYGAPSNIVISGTKLILGTRQNSNAACIVYTSLNDGATWGSATTVDATMYEMEYACPILRLDGSVLLVYGSQPTSSVTNSDIKAAILTVS